MPIVYLSFAWKGFKISSCWRVGSIRLILPKLPPDIQRHRDRHTLPYRHTHIMLWLSHIMLWAIIVNQWHFTQFQHLQYRLWGCLGQWYLCSMGLYSQTGRLVEGKDPSLEDFHIYPIFGGITNFGLAYVNKVWFTLRSTRAVPMFTNGRPAECEAVSEGVGAKMWKLSINTTPATYMMRTSFFSFSMWLCDLIVTDILCNINIYI